MPLILHLQKEEGWVMGETRANWNLQRWAESHRCWLEPASASQHFSVSHFHDDTHLKKKLAIFFTAQLLKHQEKDPEEIESLWAWLLPMIAGSQQVSHRLVPCSRLQSLPREVLLLHFHLLCLMSVVSVVYAHLKSCREWNSGNWNFFIA